MNYNNDKQEVNSINTSRFNSEAIENSKQVEIRCFLDYLNRHNSDFMLASELADIWGLTEEQVALYVKVLSIPVLRIQGEFFVPTAWCPE